MADWVVIVDDDATSLKIVGQILSKNNKRVTALKSGEALLDYIQGNVPDIILLDVNMPDMDGFETLEKLREIERINHIDSVPVVLLTADDDEATEKRGYEMGIKDYLKKPMRPDILLEKIDAILKNSSMESAADTRDTETAEKGGLVNQVNLRTISNMIAESSVSNTALQLDEESFIHVYKYVMRYVKKYHKNACRLLFTLLPIEELSGNENEEYCRKFCQYVKQILRKSDLMMRYGKNQVFILMTDIKEDAIAQVIGSTMRTWNQQNEDVMSVSYEVDFVESEELERASDEQPWVVVVDDDVTNLKMAGHILSKNNMRVTAIKSGKALLEFLKDNRPSLILLDVRMPEMDGFETLKRLAASETEIADIPVIFLTANDDEESEKNGLALGAIDFIRKPFVPEVLVMRVTQVIEMIRLQRNLASEVRRKTKENEELFIHVVKSLADAIDAKDKYTNGHSGRVAEYSREIAKRAGLSSKAQSDIYMMGLLHDVGKIGIPDAVINKPGRLNDEEFEIIKKHPVIGSQILKNIKEMPSLATGARWHHERYGGGGYPDGLSGNDIPEEARIIAVADAYDAMTSYRSYRDVIPQEKVREEMVRCSGTQFDPRFANIMIEMIDEDKGYNMRENK